MNNPAIYLIRHCYISLIIVCLALLAGISQAQSPKLYVFDCGSLKLADITIFNVTPEETPVREMFVPCYLIEHSKGRLLWDGGLPKSWADSDGPVVIDGGSGEYKRWIVDQLADMNLTPADINYAAYSHLHFDHAGAANYFLDSTVIMQRAEWASAFSTDRAFVDTSLYEKLPQTDLKIIEGDYDVFGDGTVQLIYTPGHTPGHQSILIRLENLGPLVLTGDLYHTRANRSLRRPPNFNHDAKQTLASFDRIEALIEAEGATLWIEHDKALADTLKKAPVYYD